MNNYKVKIEYLGTNYHGFVKQADLLTVQGVLEKTLNKILKESVYVQGSGRTDAKVHAFCQVISFETNCEIKPYGLLKALNSNLPQDIIAKDVEIVDKRFHARFSAISKTYMYILNIGETPSAFNFDRELYVKYRLNLDKMKEACKKLIGKHDFAGFMSQGSVITDTVREIFDVKFVREGDLVKIFFTADGFLYNQVRIMIGTLIDIGRGRDDVDVIDRIFETKDRSLAGDTALPQGLYLYDVKY